MVYCNIHATKNSFAEWMVVIFIHLSQNMGIYIPQNGLWTLYLAISINHFKMFDIYIWNTKIDNMNEMEPFS